jgi:hypothetical protein
MKRRSKEKSKLAGAASRSALHESGISTTQYAAMTTLPMNLSVTDVRDSSQFSLTLPPLARPPAAQLSATMKPKGAKPGTGRGRGLMVQPLTPADIRAEAERELVTERPPLPPPGPREKGKLRPLRGGKPRRDKKPTPKPITHLELIRFIEDSKKGDQDQYYYCKRGHNFYEFYGASFEDIRTDEDDYITISSRVGSEECDEVGCDTLCEEGGGVFAAGGVEGRGGALSGDKQIRVLQELQDREEFHAVEAFGEAHQDHGARGLPLEGALCGRHAHQQAAHQDPRAPPQSALQGHLAGTSACDTRSSRTTSPRVSTSSRPRSRTSRTSSDASFRKTSTGSSG